MQPDNRPRSSQSLAILRRKHGTTARGYHCLRSQQQLCQHLGLKTPKFGFT
jgi:hypothetical protein